MVVGVVFFGVALVAAVAVVIGVLFVRQPDRVKRARFLVVAMPARIAINKAIELAIQFVAGLNRERATLESAPEGLGLNRRRFSPDSSIVLLLPQGEDLEDNREYFERLVAYARHCKIKLVYGGNVVIPDRRFRHGDLDRYPFYGTYQAVDLVCSPPNAM